MFNCLRIGITVGEPAGIGPDIAVHLAQRDDDDAWIFFCDPEVLVARAKRLGLPLTLETYDGEIVRPQRAGSAVVVSHKCHQRVIPGQLATAHAPSLVASLDDACRRAQCGQLDALVTAPVHKGIISQAGYPFTGHTEFFRDVAGVSEVVMMLETRGLRVSLVTTHCPLAAVAEAITAVKVEQHCRMVHAFLQQSMQIANPRLLVAGLNPHAGEQGLLGHEELQAIIPAIRSCQADNLQISGPYAADTLFVPARLRQADAVVSMYHDQGLPVLKHMGFGQAVNITIGLPFIRTSVDHGVALDIAGTGKADPSSLLAALTRAKALAKQSKANNIRQLDKVLCC